MMTPDSIHIVRADDWAGLYIDGELVHEGHGIDADDVLQALGLAYTTRWAEQYWIEDRGGRLPDLIGDVP